MRKAYRNFQALRAKLREPDPEALAAGLTAEPVGRGWAYHDPKLTERRERWMRQQERSEETAEVNVDAVRVAV